MRILVADHDSTMVETVARMLRDDFTVDVATSKATCVDLLRARSGINVIVASERLDDGSGLELLSQANKRWPEVLRIFAVEPSRLALLTGRLKPFGLFQTIPYPIDPERLRSVLVLAIAELSAQGHVQVVQEIIIDDDEEEEEQEIPAAAAAAPAARSRNPVVTPLPRPAVRPSAPVRTPAVPGERRVANRPVTRTPLPAQPPMRATEPLPNLDAIDSLAEASRTAAALRAAAPPPSRSRVGMVWIPVAVVAAVGLAFGLYKMFGQSADADRPPAPPPPLASEPRTVPGVGELVADVEAALTSDDFARARAGVNKLRELVPDHPRLAFLDALVKRGEQTQKLLAERAAAEAAAQQPAPAVAAPEPSPRTEAVGSVFPGRTLEVSTEPAPAEVEPAPPEPIEQVDVQTTHVEAPPTPVAVRVPEPRIEPHRLIRKIPPTYPRAAEMAGTEGFVELDFTVTPEGNVEDVTVASSSPPEVFDRAAINAVRKWKYSPRTENGTPVATRTKTRIEFKLAK